MSRRIGENRRIALPATSHLISWLGRSMGPRSVTQCYPCVRNNPLPMSPEWTLARLEAPPGFEPGMEVLQTSALPLGDGAGRIVRWSGKLTEGSGRVLDARTTTTAMAGQVRHGVVCQSTFAPGATGGQPS